MMHQSPHFNAYPYLIKFSKIISFCQTGWLIMNESILLIKKNLNIIFVVKIIFMMIWDDHSWVEGNCNCGIGGLIHCDEEGNCILSWKAIGLEIWNSWFSNILVRIVNSISNYLTRTCICDCEIHPESVSIFGSLKGGGGWLTEGHWNCIWRISTNGCRRNSRTILPPICGKIGNG